MSELKPCPFCGYDKPRIKKYYAGTIESGAAVECPKCLIELAYQEATCLQMVINAWNRRSDERLHYNGVAASENNI